MRKVSVTALTNIGVSFLLTALCYNLVSLLASSKNRIQQNSVEIVRNDSIKVNSFVILFELKFIWRLI
jgi:hypothetical protein